MLAWLRTGVSLIAFGFVIAKFGLWLRASGQPDPQLPHANLMGGVMVLLGAAVEAVGIWRYLRTQNALIHGTLIRHSPTAVVSIAIGVALVGFLLATFILVRTNP
jgi:putative membrane protein